MSGKRSIAGSIMTPGGWLSGQVAFDNTILTVEGRPSAVPEPPFVLPGFVDCHVHGGGGADVMDGVDAIGTAARLHAKHGTTSFCPTSVTAPIRQIDRFIQDVTAYTAAPAPDGARVLGAHLEGPFLNPDKLGAQPPFAIPVDTEALAAWLATGVVRIMTFAPEVDADGQLQQMLDGASLRGQIGHTLSDYETASDALKAGAGVTHLFNAMSGLSHRSNGATGAAFAHAEYAEVIPDLIHVEAGAILAARRAIPNLYAVTDATAGAGMPDGAYRLGGREVVKKGGAMRLPDGTLAGSALTMDQALRNLVAMGLPLEEASRRVSQIPSDWLGRGDLGRLAPGAHADIVVLDAALQVTQVVVGGQDSL